MPFETRMSEYNPRIHTSNDTLANMDSSGAKALKFAQMALAYVIELAADTSSTPPPPPPSNVLEDGVPQTNLSAATGTDLNFTFDVPVGANNITVDMSGGTGDADLYVKFGSVPTDSSYDCRPYAGGNNESCTLTDAGGTHHVRAKAYSSFSGVTLVGNYDTDGGGTGGLPVINETRSSISLAKRGWSRHTQVLEAGYSSLTVTTSGGSGNVDLYARLGTQSTKRKFDCSSTNGGNTESCVLNNPGAGTWYIDVYGSSSSSGVTLNWITAE
jgi:hypothetical protein